MRRLALCLLALWGGLLPCAAAAREPDELVFLAPANHAMPLLELRGGGVTRGILKDLGDALAASLGLRARYLVRPSLRISESLARGEGELLCYVLPGWIAGDFHWTPALFEDAELLAASAAAPPLTRPEELADRPVGTVLGYRYLLERQLGPRFRRVDAPSMLSNLRKLERGHIEYGLFARSAYAHFVRENPRAGLRELFEIWRFSPRCALSRRSSLAPQRLDAALVEMQRDGRLQQILARYR